MRGEKDGPRFGVIGAGLIGGKRAEALVKLGCRPIAVFDPNDDKSARFAASFGAARANDVDELLEAVGNDGIVVVATTHVALAPAAERAIRAGLNVLVEKPGAINLHYLDGLIHTAARAKGHTQVGFNHRFHPAVRVARGDLQRELLGSPILVRATYGHGGRQGYEEEWRFQKDVSGGGELLDQGSHLIDLANYLLAGSVEHVYSSLASLYWPGAVEDNAFLHLREPRRQVEVWLHVSWTEWKNKFLLEVFCERGKLVVEGLGGSYGPETYRVHEMVGGLGPPVIRSIEFPPGDSSWLDESEDFMRGIGGEATLGAKLDDARKVLSVVERAYQK
ncbi:Gfo/Idh/MocA family protein [Ferrimicrobium sp.]|uniref:Gfo/Idh/MocA family protein n=1 Tax=Ferrimicrobium sp. TaxID=2926050 RepID=UPI0026088ACE|nr:Gfo/Idh/MocA family oxidoreductase [Ferrimicrobium sp.]